MLKGSHFLEIIEIFFALLLDTKLTSESLQVVTDLLYVHIKLSEFVHRVSKAKASEIVKRTYSHFKKSKIPRNISHIHGK